MQSFAIETRGVGFRSDGDLCDADLLLPRRGVSKPPIVVMAHGFGGLRSFGLLAFAERFAHAGLAVLVFDYRGFGKSGGMPRNLVDGERHVQDYFAAIDYVRTLPEVDATRLGLWGTSYSGGHVIVAAAQRPEVKAIVSQVPFVDGVASARLFPLQLLPLALAAGARDLLRALRGQPPVLAPIVADSGLRALTGADCVEGYRRIVPPGSEHSERVPARIFLTLPLYRPTRYARRVQAQALVIAATNDTLIPVSAVRRAAARMPHGELIELPIGHFDPYQGEPFERVVAVERDFLLRAL